MFLFESENVIRILLQLYNTQAYLFRCRYQWPRTKEKIYIRVIHFFQIILCEVVSFFFSKEKFCTRIKRRCVRKWYQIEINMFLLSYYILHNHTIRYTYYLMTRLHTKQFVFSIYGQYWVQYVSHYPIRDPVENKMQDKVSVHWRICQCSKC